MNIQPSKKYKISPAEIEKKSANKRKIQNSIQYDQIRKNTAST